MAEMGAAERAAFLNSILESSTEYSIVAIDVDGTIRTWNEGARRLYGYEASDVAGKANSFILHVPEDVKSGRAQAILDEARQDGKWSGELKRARMNGQEFAAFVTITRRVDEAGRFIGFTMISRDFTEPQQLLRDHERLEDQLRCRNDQLEEQNSRAREANRLKSEFLANMSHELRTPLNGIIGFAALMHDAKVGPVSADHKEYLGDILVSSRHLLQLINDLLDLAKVESGKMEFWPELIDVRKLVGEVRDIVRTLTAEKRIRLTCEVDPAIEAIVIDPAKLKQVLYNYLSNALKFTPEEGTIVVRVRPEDDDRFRLEVEDSGIGIRPQDFNRLFIEFQQLDATSSGRYQGTGLGLALTRRIVEAQGGETGVTSTLGKGSCFYAVLPRISRGAELETPAASAPVIRRPGQRAVLVIEDDAGQRAWIVSTLTAAGYAVDAVATGEAAIRMAEDQPFDAVTVDLLLPDMSGWDVLHAIRAGKRNRDVAAIVVTVVAEKGAGMGFVIHDFLVKPVAVDELLGALQRVPVPTVSERSLLIVDDDPDAATLVGPALRDHGFHLTVVRDCASGLEAARANPPSAVVLDLLMPGMGGLEFLHQFRLTDIGRKTPVIVWTVKDLTIAERRRLQASAQAIVTKGAGSTDALIAELAVHLDQSKQEVDGR
jgi:PAS domain S-box-containing protein